MKAVGGPGRCNEFNGRGHWKMFQQIMIRSEPELNPRPQIVHKESSQADYIESMERNTLFNLKEVLKIFQGLWNRRDSED